MRTAKRLTVSFICLFILTFTGCANSLFYYPNSTEYLKPEDMALQFEDVYFESFDKTKLHGWFFPAKGEAWGTVVHFHGNAGNVSANLNMMGFIPSRGLNLFMFDYRGYGNSSGRPDRKGVFEDSLSALLYVFERPDVDKDKVFLIGQSLGGANAIAVSSSKEAKQIKALVIDSSFYSYRSIVKDKIGAIPVIGLFRWPLSFIMATDSYHSGDMICSISPVPVMIIHGTSDKVVPYKHGEMLFERACEPKTFVELKDGGHIEALTPRNRIYRDKIIDFFKEQSTD